MKSNTRFRCLFVAGVLVPTCGFAEEYDFEIGLAFDRTQFDGRQTITTPGGTIFSSDDSDTDEIDVFGDWYFAGLSDDAGPRARAAFVDRASSLGFRYSRSEQSTALFRNSDDPAFPIPPLDTSFDLDGDLFAADFRYVDRDSGWFGNAGLFSLSASTNVTGTDDNDATGWNLGFGKYLLETTALSLDVGEVDGDGDADASVVAVTFTHLGDLGGRWQYAVDLGFSHLNPDQGADRDTWAATIAFYPTRDFEFGINLEDQSLGGQSLVDLDTTSVGGFVSWYATPNVELSARYQVDDVGYLPDVLVDAPTVRDADQDSFGVSATVRF